MSRNMTPAEQEEAKAKLLRCAKDEVFGLENCITITDKAKQSHLVKLWDSQKLVIEHTGRINYDIKIRQEGRTTLYLMRALLRARFKNNFEALILAHEEDAAPVLFNRLKEMDKNLPELVRGSKATDAAKALRYSDSNSLLRIVTAGASERVSGNKARSGTPDWVHVTEAPLIPYLDVLAQGIIGSLPPQGVAIFEGTSNGPRGTFHAACVEIRTKGKEIVPGQVWRLGEKVCKFTGLLGHEEYRILGAFEGPQDEEEERLLSLGALTSTLLWRRAKLEEFANDPKRSKGLSAAKQFKREYPATFEEAFEESGSNFFQPSIMRLEKEAARLWCEQNPPVVLGLMRQNGQRPIEVRPTDGNRFTIYELPRDGYKGQYLVFGDVGAGNSESDPDSIYVLNRLNNRIVAKSHGLLGAMRHSACMLALAEYYYGAYIGWDATGIGAELRPLLLQSGYPLDRIFHRRRDYKNTEARHDTDWMLDTDGFGLLWSSGNRDVAISLLRHGIESRTLWTPDEDFFDEGQQFGYNENGKAEAAIGYHDDRVMTKAGLCYLHPILPAPSREIPLKEFESANKLRDKIRHSLMARARQQGPVYEGMEA